MDSSGGGIVFIFIVLAILLAVGSRVMDEGRIQRYIEERGGRMLEKRWVPFGRGWYGDNNRIYRVRYVDRDGNEHEALCKTHLLSGVYWTEDTIVGYAKGRDPGSLEEENQRLRAEIERLKRSE